ncbi:MAG: hypothetical protein ACQEW8_06185 [Actinomycetota bacterium]
MSRRPPTPPQGTRVATAADFARLLRLLNAAQILTLRQRSLLIATCITIAILAAEVIVFTAILGPEIIPVFGIFAAVVLILTALVLLGHTAFRLRDPHRYVLLAPDRRAGLDVIFRRDGTVTLANHARLLGATSAPALRAGVGAWLMSMADRRIVFKAQNRTVADLYIREFPHLTAEEGSDILGRVRVSAGPPSPGTS